MSRQRFTGEVRKMTVRLPADLDEKLSQASGRKWKSKAEIIREALENYLDQ